MPKKPNPMDNALVKRMDGLAADLLDDVRDSNKNIGFEGKLDVLEKIGKWIAIRNRLEGNDDGSGLDAYKAKLKSAAARGTPISHRFAATAGNRGYTHPTADDRGGPQLSALKSRLPDRAAGRPDGDSDGSEH